MLDALFDFDEIRVTSADPSRARHSGRRSRRRSANRSARLDTWRETIEGADIVVEATRLAEPEPLLRTDWIPSPGLWLCPTGR